MVINKTTLQKSKSAGLTRGYSNTYLSLYSPLFPILFNINSIIYNYLLLSEKFSTMLKSLTLASQGIFKKEFITYFLFICLFWHEKWIRCLKQYRAKAVRCAHHENRQSCYIQKFMLWNFNSVCTVCWRQG